MGLECPTRPGGADGTGQLTTRSTVQSWECGPAKLPPTMEECAGNLGNATHALGHGQPSVEQQARSVRRY